MESSRPVTPRDLEILANPSGYDSVQVVFSTLASANHTTERVTAKTGFMPVDDYELLQTRPSIEEPELTVYLQELQERGLDPAHYIKFIGGRAILLCEQ